MNYRPVSTWCLQALLCIKKVAGKKKERSLDTPDRKIAERRFKEWPDCLGKVDVEGEKTTLRQLHQKLVA